MQQLLRRVGLVAVGVAALGLTGFTAAFGVSSSKMSRKYDARLTTVHVPADAEAVAWGSHLVNAVASCQDCHGADLSGTVLIDDAAAVLAAPNLTSGRGGVGREFTDADWVRGIRHGVRKDGSSLLVMPSYAYANFSDRDLGALIAYLKQLPAVDNELPSKRVKPLGRVLMALGMFDEEFVAKKVPHREDYGDIEAGVTLEYGTYLANVGGCTSCHRPDLSGGPIGPAAPPAADIGRDALAAWTLDDFRRALREGMRPDGSAINEAMPWRVMGNMTDDELAAVWLFIQEGAYR
jgi:cytochrome c553